MICKILSTGFFIYICLISGCSTNQKRGGNRFKMLKSSIDSIDKINKEYIDSMGFTQFENEARWILYTKNCIQRPLCKESYQIPNNTFFGFLKLKLAEVNYFDDTLSIHYMIIYNDTLSIGICSKNPEIFEGVVFNTKNGRFIGYVVANGIFNELDASRKPIYPAVQNVVDFAKANKNKLDTWFKSELVRRKIIQE